MLLRVTQEHYRHIQIFSSSCQFTYFLPPRDDAHSAAAGPRHARLFPRRARVHAAVLLQPGLRGLRGLQTRRGGVRVRRRRRVSRGQLCLHLHTYTCLHHTCVYYTCLQTTCHKHTCYLCTKQRVCGQTERRTVVPRDILQVGRDTCNSSTAARVYCVGTGTSTAAPAPASRPAAAPPTGDTALPVHGPGGGADSLRSDSLKDLAEKNAGCEDSEDIYNLKCYL